MVTNEGSFPKIGNDPVYASEINRFSKFGGYQCLKSWGPIISGTNLNNLGSIVFPAGSLTNPTFLDIEYLIRQGAAGGGNTGQAVFTVSGADNYFVLSGAISTDHTGRAVFYLGTENSASEGIINNKSTFVNVAGPSINPTNQITLLIQGLTTNTGSPYLYTVVKYALSGIY